MELPSPHFVPLDLSGTGLGYFLKSRPETDTATIQSETDSLKINWKTTIIIIIFHAFGLYGATLLMAGQFMWRTLIFFLITGELAGFGVTAGVHRLWSHKSYKTRKPLTIIMTILYTMSMQGPIWLWVLVHRIHHKYSDTDKDPHNVTRGFWYSHVGWIIFFDYEKVLNDAKAIDMSDIQSDPIVMFQSRYFYLLMILVAYPLPSLIPWLFWGETLEASIFVGTSLRHLTVLHSTFNVNSLAHLFGSKPFEKSIFPSQNKLVTFFALGEGWHNFHHTFPWDYRTSEIGLYNPSTTFINFFARLGWAYDLKEVSKNIVTKRAARTGDGSYVNSEESISSSDHHHHHHHGSDGTVNENNNPWGWGDKDVPEENLSTTQIVYPEKPNILD